MDYEHDVVFERELHEECGVFAIFNRNDAASLSYFGLHALQHRGQEAAGIATSNTKHITCHKGKGLLTDVFDNEILEKLAGIHAIGHVRYAKAEANQLENVQPIVVRSHENSFAVAHNGQIVNAQELKTALEETGSIFQGNSDSELLAHYIQVEEGDFKTKIRKACMRFEGAFAFVILTTNAIYAVRDKYGLRPLSLAQVDAGGYCISSETCAFDIVGASHIRDIQPGEVVEINAQGVHSFPYTTDIAHHMCAMEYIYFARPDSNIDGINVHTARRLSGCALAKGETIPADIVIGVPDSSISAAIGFSEESGIPYEIGLIKNRYIGRTFIQPTQTQREQGVRMKLSAVASIVKDKRVIMIDDSIVRGTTSKRIVQLLKEAGAKEVHVRIASAPLISPCFYGVDTSTYEELISARLNRTQLCSFIGANTLRFMDINTMCQAFATKQLCTACFNGTYCTNLFQYKTILEKENL